MSDILTVVFKTAPHAENKSVFLENTTRFNNEILKQRLSCIPVHIVDIDDAPLDDYLLEVNVENTTDTIIYVTTEDFKIKYKSSGEYLSAEKTREMFPPNDITGQFIDFVRLRPRISTSIVGEAISLTCEFSISNVNDNGMFNVVSTCSYGCSVDRATVDREIIKQTQKWNDGGLTKDEIEFETKNWMLLEAGRFIVPNSFEFIIESVGVFSNYAIFVKAIDIIIDKLGVIKSAIDDESLPIVSADDTVMANCYIITLENEDYTIGKIVEYMMYNKFYYGVKTLTFCGFLKKHPHDNYCIIKVAYKSPTEITMIHQNLLEVIRDLTRNYEIIKQTAVVIDE